LVGWELAKGTTFPYKKFFVPQTHFLVQSLVNYGGNFFFGGKLKGDVRRIVDEKVYRNFEGAATIFADLRMNLSWTRK